MVCFISVNFQKSLTVSCKDHVQKYKQIPLLSQMLWHWIVFNQWKIYPRNTIINGNTQTLSLIFRSGRVAVTQAMLIKAWRHAYYHATAVSDWNVCQTLRYCNLACSGFTVGPRAKYFTFACIKKHLNITLYLLQCGNSWLYN